MNKPERKAFLWYIEWMGSIKDLPDESIGKIVRGINTYVSDGIIPELPGLEKMAFSFIKGDLDRDAVKYTDTISKKSIAGRMGNLKKYKPDLYRQVELSDLTLEQAEELAKGRSAISATAHVANVADKEDVEDNVKDNVEDKEDVNDILLKKESKGVSKSRGQTLKFSKPTLEEIKAYCLERGNMVDADTWFNYYTANGWKVGKNQMKDWKAAVRTWEKNGFSKSAVAAPKKTGLGVEVPQKYGDQEKAILAQQAEAFKDNDYSQKYF